MESKHQKKSVLLLKDLKSKGKILDFFATQNENPYSKHLNKGLIFKLEVEAKKMGKNKGVSDLTIITINKVLFVELKDAPRQLKTKLSTAHTKTSTEQIAFLSNINKSEVCIGKVCYGYDDFKKFLIDCLIEL